MPDTVSQAGWCPPDKEFCGPDDLADAIFHARDAHSFGPDSVSDLSKQGVHQLVKFCYYASQCAEEGRFPRFRVFAPNSKCVNRPDNLVMFKPAVFIEDVERLRRLAPVASVDRALSIVEGEGGLYCDGLIDLTPSEIALKPGAPDCGTARSVPIGLLVRVDGPGQLRANDGHFTFMLRQGSLRCCRNYSVIPNIDDWLRDLGRRMATRLPEGSRLNHSPIFRDGWESWGNFQGLWADVLAKAIESRQGASFVILPEGIPYQRFVINKFSVDNLLLIEKVADVWQVWEKYSGCKELKKMDYHVRMWNWHRRHLVLTVQAIADVGSVDGCVVLDRELTVLGFGAKINVADKDIEEAGLLYADFKTHEKKDEKDISQFGTRHQSAFRLCKALPGAMVFVVSQDGDLRLFFSDDDYVYFFDKLTPSSRHSPEW